MPQNLEGGWLQTKAEENLNRQALLDFPRQGLAMKQEFAMKSSEKLQRSRFAALPASSACGGSREDTEALLSSHTSHYAWHHLYPKSVSAFALRPVRHSNKLSKYRGVSILIHISWSEARVKTSKVDGVGIMGTEPATHGL